MLGGVCVSVCVCVGVRTRAALVTLTAAVIDDGIEGQVVSQPVRYRKSDKVPKNASH